MLLRFSGTKYVLIFLKNFEINLIMNNYILYKKILDCIKISKFKIHFKFKGASIKI